MKRIWTIVLVVGMVMMPAVPAAGKGKPDKPTPPPSAPISVSLEAAPRWVSEAGDTIRYTVNVQNKTRSLVAVVVEYPGGTEEWEIEAKSTRSEELISYLVGEAAIALCEDPPEGEEPICEITESVTVRYEGGEVVAGTSVEVNPYPPCGFDPAGGTEVIDVDFACIWNPDPTIEHWTISVEPTATRRTNVQVTVRDHVPGNWCILEDGSGGAINQRWKPGDDPVTLDVYLPGIGGPLGDGVCLSGGAGGDYFAVGNPASFYLVADGTVTVSPTPIP